MGFERRQVTVRGDHVIHGGALHEIVQRGPPLHSGSQK
jgi:hypothetical protein